MNESSVRLYGRHVGRLSVERDGKMSFRYDDGWLQRVERSESGCHPLSLSMPARAEPYGHDRAGPFFDGLLPDNPNVRRALASHFQVDPDDDYGLLHELGRECPGAVSVMPLGSPEVSEDRVTPGFTVMSEGDLARHIRELPQRPLFVDADGEVRLSLAGVHHKAAILLVEGQPALARGLTPTSHILKVDIVGLPDSVRVEHFCLTLAAEVGLQTVRSTVRMAEDIPYLLVARYDRALAGPEGSRYLRRFHQEDFCQALARFPREKYEKDGGPGWRESFALMDRMTDPAADRSELLGRAVFQYLVGNPDAHAKNYSVVCRATGPRLSRLYDVNNAAAFRPHYREQRHRLAMFIGGERDPDLLEERHWTMFAAEAGIRPEIVLGKLVSMAEAIIEKAPDVRRAMSGSPADSPLLDAAVQDIVERCEKVVSRRLQPPV